MLQDASRVCVAVLRCMFHVHIHKACAHMRAVYCTVDYSIRMLAYPDAAIESLYLCLALVCVLLSKYKGIKKGGHLTSKTYTLWPYHEKIE